MTLSSTRRSGARRRPTTWSGLVVGAALLLATAAGCGKSDKPTDTADKQGLSTVEGGTPTASATATDPSTHTSSAPAATSAKPSRSSNAPSGPKITSFVVAVKASCGSPGGPGFDAVPGSVKLSWAVTGATQVGLSIDDTNTFKQYGHGSWKDYPAVGSDTLPFACSGAAAADFTHKYTIDTIDGGTHVSKTLTLTAHWQGA